MRAAEKAKEIYDKHYFALMDTESAKEQEIIVSILAKKCALITVSEILKETNFVSYYDAVKRIVKKL
jgi:hypothetical protein